MTTPRRRGHTRSALLVTVALAVGLAPLAPAPPAAAASRRAANDPAVRSQQSAVDAASKRLDELAAEASAALEAYQVALRAQEDAQAAHNDQVARWSQAQMQLDASRTDMARFASQAHRYGAAASGVAGFVAVAEAESPGDLEARIVTLRQVGRAEARAVSDAAEDEAGQEAIAVATEATAREASATAEAAAAAKGEADERVAAQRKQVDDLAALVAATRRAAASGGDAGEVLAGASAVRLSSTGGWGGSGRGCSGDDLGSYANGRIPTSALCPIPGSSDELLRSDAAAAFGALTDAYSRRFGRAICVSDGYRDLGSQVAVARAKPGLAAKPGTSNHGWGVAVDLCGGIEGFSTAEHGWMRQNAPAYGWFHPKWAQQSGSKPEAWHWEYAG